MEILYLLRILMAHLITDFLLQSGRWVQHKQLYGIGSYLLWIHALLTGLVVWLFLPEWGQWHVALLIAVSHLLIDWWKISRRSDDFRYFMLDQVLHVLVLIVVWLWQTGLWRESSHYFYVFFNDTSNVAVMTAFLLVIWPVGYAIGKATAGWREELERDEEEGRDSLAKAGTYIGIFERILVLLFVLSGRFEAIGFLIAAKSILRFGDRNESKPRKQTEYVLIGTLMSFTVSILIGLATRYIVMYS